VGLSSIATCGTYKIMQEKVRQFNENKEIQDLLKGRCMARNPGLRGMMSKYKQGAGEEAQGGCSFDPAALASRRLPYERPRPTPDGVAAWRALNDGGRVLPGKQVARPR